MPRPGPTSPGPTSPGPITPGPHPRRPGRRPSAGRSLRVAAALAPVLLACAPTPAAAAVRLEIAGLPENLEQNVRIYVGKLPADNPRAVRRFLRDLPQQVNVALSALGYYAADVDIDTREERPGKRGAVGEAVDKVKGAVGAGPRDGTAAQAAKAKEAEDALDTVIEISVEPNDPVLVDLVNLQVKGPARLDPEFMKSIARIPLRKGRVFLSGDYEAAKNLLASEAQDLGYFDFRFEKSGVRVSRRQLSAEIDLIADTGERYTFGDVIYQDDRLSDAFLSRWIPFAPGDPYSTDAIARATENLRDSGYFSSVRVLPQQDARYGRTVPVRIALTQRAENLVGVGVGYATDIGPRVSLSWEKPLINRRGHSAKLETELSGPRQSIGFSYRIPRGLHPRTDYYGLEFGLQNTDIKDTKSFLSTLGVQRVERTTHGFTQSLFLRWEHEESTVSDREITTDLVLPGASYARTRSKGSPFTTWGQSEAFQLYGGNESLLSSIDFYKATVDLRFLRGFLERNTVIAGLSLGWIESNDFTRLPVSQRFFAGGDRSVRGFGFREIGPRNIADDVVGGRYLETASLEYQYRFLDKWSGATFVDAGRAFNAYDAAYSVGAGVGVRWQSPVGPFRLDVAVPVEDPSGDADNFRVHLSLGPEL